MKNCYISAFPVIALICLAAHHRFGFIRRRLHLKLLPILLFILCLSFNIAAFSYEYGTGVKLIGSDANGVILELEVGNLAIKSSEFDNRIYHVISYKDCGFTTEIGKPKLPVSRAFIGIPPWANLSVSIINSKFSDLSGYVPLPVPDKVLQTSPDGIDSLNEKFTIDRDFYSQKAFYPQVNANVAYYGYIRHQRVAAIELHPVQYNPASKILRKYTKLTVRVSFLPNGEYIPGQIISPSEFNITPRSDRDFEKLYKSLVLNYEEAKQWRKRIPDASLAPKVFNSESEAYKIFVSKPGIYRLDYETLKNIGINLSNVDPRTFKLHFRDKQVPIYVRGEADGKFDKDDYFEFFSPEVKNIYTPWDVYWLTYKGAKGLRMAEKSGMSKSRTVREVTSFHSVVRLEEDHLHNKLQNVQPDPNNLEAWFESRDHWFWTGIENGSAKNEVTVKFPVYDMAQSLARPNFKIELVGCTNFEHNVMISINGYRIGQEANWSRQDIYSYDGTMPANSLVEGINELRLTRIGTNSGDGENTDSYPYQIYLNWFGFGYMRKLMAVNDILDFISPESKEPGIREINRYSIGGFAQGEVEVFQIEGSNAISKFRDLIVEEYKLDPEELERAKTISSINNQGVSIFDKPKIKDTAYKVIFEDQGGRSYRYIAVSSSSILKPDRIELDTKSSLKNPSNQADYIIISHPVFIEAANELANWRNGQKGGSFRTKVIDVTDIYDEFNSGMVNPKAIKDFLKFAYHNWTEPTISYVLIFGDATYDFLGINENVYKEPPELIGFIPTFYSWTTYGQTAVDHWYSTINGKDGFPDIYLGRIPVENIDQAKAVLYKIMANESGKFNGPWRKRIISVADDDSHAAGDEIFRIGLEEIWQNHTPYGYDTEKIYLKDIIQEQQSIPDNFRRPGDVAEERIKEAFAKEAVIAQYAGHGGRHVWAHEIIFSITDIKELKETNVYPLLIVLSCYNGFFDLPGEISMSEGMLRADKRGIVAMISATRLTYGTGNVALNNSLFDGIFKDKIYKIGHLLTKAKIDVLLNEGMSWLSQMEEYTLFGDPASWLNMPDYEIKPQLANSSVSPGGKLELKSGQVVTTLDGKPASFDGEFIGVVELLDGRQLSKKAVSITKGIYPAISFDIPENINESEGVLKLYGENNKETAVGGVRFGINVPFISNIAYEIMGNGIQFYIEISDDAGFSGIKSAKV
ncbi:hypothetical protein FJZ33_02020, partial [Candidatus Poribacteria bacterium]|nr:hypothetical protein [Candidatus Poribacteria bacterium]